MKIYVTWWDNGEMYEDAYTKPLGYYDTREAAEKHAKECLGSDSVLSTNEIDIKYHDKVWVHSDRDWQSGYMYPFEAAWVEEVTLIRKEEPTSETV